MSSVCKRKLFNKAIDLPAEFVKKLRSDVAPIEIRDDGIHPLDSIEVDPAFDEFIEAICQDAMENPKRLEELSEVWGDDWDQLLEGVDDSEKINTP